MIELSLFVGLCNDELVTIGASFYRDHKDVLYINVQLYPPESESDADIIEKLYEKLFVGCVYEHEDVNPVFFIPTSSLDTETRVRGVEEFFAVDKRDLV